MVGSEFHNNIVKFLRTDVERAYWISTTPDERDRFVGILKKDGLAEAIKEVQRCALAAANASA